MTALARHVLLPLLAALLFFSVALSPVHVLGCAGRGLLALLISLGCGAAALHAAVAGARLREAGRPGSGWWLARSVILAVPVAAMLALA